MATLKPDEIEALLAEANDCTKRGDFAHAIKLYKSVVHGAPSAAGTWLKLGDLQAKTGQVKDAIFSYDHIARYYHSQGYWLKAIAVLNQIRELIANYAPNLTGEYQHIPGLLGECSEHAGFVPEALQAYSEAAQQLERSRKLDESFQLRHRMCHFDPENPLPRMELGEAYARQGDQPKALEALRGALSLLRAQGRTLEALRVYARLHHLEPDPDFDHSIADIYLDDDDRESALKALAKLSACFKRNPRNPRTLELLDRAFTKLGQRDKALEVKKERARIALEDGDSALYAALTRELTEALPSDTEVQSLANARSPNTPRSHQRHVAAKALDVDEALHELAAPQGAVATDLPDRISEPDQTALDEAERWRRDGDMPRAIDVIRRAIERSPRVLELRDRLRSLYQQAGQQRALLDETANIADIYARGGEVDMAQAQVDYVLSVDPHHFAALQVSQRLAAARQITGSHPALGRAPLPAPAYTQVGRR